MQRRAVKSASRTFGVLELFMEQRRPLRLNEIYLALGYPQSSATNLLKSMVMGGYLNYNRSTRTYLPTTRVSALGSWLPGFIHADGEYRALVDEIQWKTDETVGLITQNDLFIQYIILREPGHEHKMVPAVGTMRLMVDASAGLALMSRMTDRQIDKICRYTNYYELGDDARVSVEDTMAEIRWIRHTGYCYRANKPSPEVSSISFTLDEDLHGIPLAIGVGGLADRISRNRAHIVTTMRECIAAFKARRGGSEMAHAAE